MWLKIQNFLNLSGNRSRALFLWVYKLHFHLVYISSCMRKLIVPWETKKKKNKRNLWFWLPNELEKVAMGQGEMERCDVGTVGTPERHCQVDKQRRKLGLGLGLSMGLVWGLHMSRRFNFIERMTGTPTGKRTRRTRGHTRTPGHTHTHTYTHA